MEEPLPLHEEPKDEDARTALPLGTFTGVTTADARRSLDELEGDASGLRVARVVENSPGDAAGLEEDDLLLDVSVDGGAPRALRWPSEWRQVELDAKAGARLRLRVDRAGAIRTAEILAVPRARRTDRNAAQRFREEKRAGFVVRTATEVEARGAGLGPGGGAVVVGLAAASPWRQVGLVFGDLVARVDGRDVAHPQELLAAVREAEEDAVLAAEVFRGSERLAFELPVTQRRQELRSVQIPFVYSFERSRGASEMSILAGAVKHRTTAAAWEWRILWLLSFGGGDADRLEEIE
jgi:S1-C subfamily serine protease